MANLSNINNKFLVTTGGNVGIGDTGPSTRLTVDVPAILNNTVNIFQLGDDTNGLVFKKFWDSGGIAWRLNKGVSGINMMTFSQDGKIGIGTDSPLTTLHVNQTNDAQVLVQGANKMALHQDAAWNSNILLGCYYDGSNVVYGTTNRGAFKIVGLHDSTSQPQTLSIYGASGAAAAGSTVTFNSVGFSQDEDGNVGIGTTSPSANLHVSSTSTATLKVITTGVADASVNIQGYDAGVHIGDATNGLRWAIWNDGPGTSSSLKFGSYALGTWYGDSAQVVTMTSGGNVGIGTTNPTEKLFVDGNNYNTATKTTFVIRDVGNNYDQGDNAVDIVMRSRYWSGDQNTSQNSKIRHLKDNSNGSTGTQLRFSTTTRGSGDSTDKMTILSSGNVGIGTTSPGEKLTVSGDGRFTGGSAGTLTIKHNYGYQQPNWGIKLDGDTGTTGGYLSQYINLGGFALEQGGTYYGGGPWKTDANSTSYSSVNGLNGQIVFYTNTSLTANTAFTPSERMRITSTGAISFGSTGTAYGAAGEVLTSNGNASPSWQAAGGSSPWTTSGNDIYNNNSGSVGVNNTSPSSHYGNYNQLVVGNGTDNQGMTIFAGSFDASSINFTDTTSTFSNNFVIKVDHNDFSESNNPSFQINYENNRYVTINKQTTGSSQIPQVRLGMFNSSSLPANLDHSMLEIGINNGMNNPGMVMYGDSQGNSNPFIGMVSTSSGSTITTKYLRFYHNTTLCGTIQKGYNSNSVQYLTTSDYRLKEDLKPFKALDTICKINVYNYKWKDIEGYNVNYGVLAHELQELIPEVVAGEKDEVNKKGEEEYQSVDYSKLVPHLIQSIQELKAEIELLKSK